MKKFLNKYGIYFGLLFIAGLFFYIAYSAPLCGDDWGYALNGMKSNPFEMAISFYKTWSGRFFSELYGFLVTPHKWIWNILVPILFLLIVYFIYIIVKKDKHNLLVVLAIIAIILSVDDHLRMETYTWLMGTTYVIPLMLSLLYFVIVCRVLFNEKKHNKLLLIISNLILLYIGLTMENIAAMMIVSTLAISIYAFIKKKEYALYFIINFVFSLVSLIIMRSSPGSAYRLLNDHPDWYKLSLLEKIINGYPNFIQYTFINNNYLILILSVLLCINILNTKTNIIEKIVHILINIIGVFAVFSFVLIKENNIFQDPNSIFSSIYWIIYTIDAFVILTRCLKGTELTKGIFFLCMAGGSNLVMMYSPIFGARCSLYTVFFLIVLCGILCANINDNKLFIIGLVLFMVVIIGDRTIEYVNKYTLVRKAHAERLEVIKYYQEHPEDEEAWIKRYPIYTVHSGDIEQDDTYHLDTFREYYGLTQKTIIFSYEE